jgi:hypothetical protein
MAISFRDQPSSRSPSEQNVDGNDDVWVANIGSVKNGVVLMAGADPKGHPPGIKTGDVIHLFRSGSIQLLTDTSIDPAGNVWAANNWNLPAAAMDLDPVRRTSTWVAVRPSPSSTEWRPRCSHRRWARCGRTDVAL